MIKDIQTIRQLAIELLQTEKKLFEQTKELDVAINIKIIKKIIDIIENGENNNDMVNN